jgi:hypothetical protein
MVLATLLMAQVSEAIFGPWNRFAKKRSYQYNARWMMEKDRSLMNFSYMDKKMQRCFRVVYYYSSYSSSYYILAS